MGVPSIEAEEAAALLAFNGRTYSFVTMQAVSRFALLTAYVTQVTYAVNESGAGRRPGTKLRKQ